MTDALQKRHGVQVLTGDPAGPVVATAQDALDLVGPALFDAEIVVIPATRLDERFLSLISRFAGEVMQKFANHRLRLAIVGDISRHLAAGAVRALVHDSDTARRVRFLPDMAALDARLRAARADVSHVAV